MEPARLGSQDDQIITNDHNPAQCQSNELQDLIVVLLK